MSEPVERWLQTAADDLAFARLGAQHGFHANVCFLAQQAAEKSLKAVLVRNTGTHPKLHNLVGLINLCHPHAPGIQDLLTQARILDQYYLPSRYPDGVPSGPTPHWPSADHSREAIAFAEAIFDYCHKLIHSQP